LNEFQ